MPDTALTNHQINRRGTLSLAALVCAAAKQPAFPELVEGNTALVRYPLH